MTSLILNKSDVQWRWKKLFEMPEALGVETVLEWTIDRGSSIEDLLEYLEAFVYPGILQIVAKRFLEEVALPHLPETVGNDPVFQEMLYSDVRLTASLDEEDVRRGQIVDRYAEHVNNESPKSCKRAMIACIEFILGNFARSLHNTGFCLNESEVEDFGPKFTEKRKNLEVDNALIRAARRLAVIVIEEAQKLKSEIVV